MIGVNLIPTELLIRSAVQRRVRAWAMVGVLLAGVTAVPLVIEHRQQAQVQRLKREVAEVESKLRDQRGQVFTTAQAVLDAEAELVRAQTLRTKRSWSGLLALVAECLPQEVWLTSLATDPAQPAGPARTSTSRDPAGRHLANRDREGAVAKPGEEGREPTNPAPTVILEAPTRLRLDGYALDHDGPYALMSKLKESGAFSAVEMLRAGLEPMLEGQAVHFTLTCEW